MVSTCWPVQGGEDGKNVLRMEDLVLRCVIKFRAAVLSWPLLLSLSPPGPVVTPQSHSASLTPSHLSFLHAYNLPSTHYPFVLLHGHVQSEEVRCAQGQDDRRGGRQGATTTTAAITAEIKRGRVCREKRRVACSIEFLGTARRHWHPQNTP